MGEQGERGMQLSWDVVSAGSDGACTASRSCSPCGVSKGPVFVPFPSPSIRRAGGGSCRLVRASEWALAASMTKELSVDLRAETDLKKS